MGSAHLRSLWEMLHQLNRSCVLQSIALAGSMQMRCRMLYNIATAQHATTIKVRGLEKTEIAQAINNIGWAGTEFDLSGVAGCARDAMGVLNMLEGELADPEVVRGLGDSLGALCSAFVHSLEERQILMLSSDAASAIQDLEPFGSKVADAFPSVNLDVAEASKCLAFERWTACVLHCMRALQPALLAFADAMNVPTNKQEWWPLIRNIEKEIKVQKDAQGHATLQFESEAAAHFSAIKDAWRNYAAHGQDSYDEERARSAFAATRSLMRQLSTRFSERQP